MECEDWDGLSSDSDLLEQDFKDAEEYIYTSNSSSKLQFRKVISVARWNSEVGMGAVVERKCQLWTTTGIVHSGKLRCSIEETLFLMKIGALLLLNENDQSISLETMYQQLAEEKDGCCWELYEVYRHRKSLGYIGGQHDIPWSLKRVKRHTGTVFSEEANHHLKPKLKLLKTMWRHSAEILSCGARARQFLFLQQCGASCPALINVCACISIDLSHWSFLKLFQKEGFLDSRF